MPQTDGKKLLQPASVGGKAKDNNLLVWDKQNLRAMLQYLFKPNGCMMQTKLKSIQGVGTHTGTLWLLGTCCSKTLPPAGWGVWRKEQLPLHMSEWKSRLFIWKMTAGVTKGLLIITPKWSSNFLDKLGNKQVVLQCMYLGRNGNAKILIKKVLSMKNNAGTALCRVHKIQLR